MVLREKKNEEGIWALSHIKANMLSFNFQLKTPTSFIHGINYHLIVSENLQVFS
jgi:hypothetical protein